MNRRIVDLYKFMLNCFYFIDKPIWISSFDIIRELRKKLNTRKIWHTGTLDPLATWGVILAVWNYTKLIPYLEKDTKVYEFQVMLDWITDSYDLAEDIKYISETKQEKYKKELSLEKIQFILEKYFSWDIEQIPPKYSALKINWQKAYELARKWEQIEMKSRKVKIFDIKVLNYDYPKLDLKATVSAGTYIRSIANDIGQIIWSGWYISKLRRTKIEKLDIKYAQKLEDFEETSFLDVKHLFWKERFITLEKSVLDKLNNWLKVKSIIDLKEGTDYFIEQDWIITNIIKKEDWLLIPVRKI